MSRGERPRDYRGKLKRILVRAQHNLCAYCGGAFASPDDACFDHVDPFGADDVSNYLMACRSCNSRKKQRDLEQYREYLEMLDLRDQLGADVQFSAIQMRWLESQDWFPLQRRRVVFSFERQEDSGRLFFGGVDA